MLNPEIIKEYGEDGVVIFNELCECLSEKEKDSIYAVDHYTLSSVSGLPFEIASNLAGDINELSNRIMEHMFKYDDNAIIMCERYTGEGIKIWLTTR